MGKEMTQVWDTKVLYIGHEYDKQGFAARFGPTDDEVAGKFFLPCLTVKKAGCIKPMLLLKNG
ncbi:MAG: hypothetical protein M0D57_11585 [Sphingobacteriales bacterium JAD_PAG50586_3]|nr:MAG: hypothetical protein M0D57_11585 [Sphingobacteriales bacterium JAD_PAG50586_3]